MNKCNLELTSSAIAAYRNAAKRRWAETEEKRDGPKEESVPGSLLKGQFNATKVVVFGSLVRSDCFTLWSDVDIAAWGISPRDTFRAMGAVRDLDDTIEVNLVDVETCKPKLLAFIEQEGILL